MDWPFLFVLGALAGALFLFQRLAFVRPEIARRHLAAGALVIDVRSPEEFRAGHLPQAVSLDLAVLREDLPRLVPDRNRVLLLHCLSGGRSALGRRVARNLGYAQVFNLGSLGRARRIVAQANRQGGQIRDPA